MGHQAMIHFFLSNEMTKSDSTETASCNARIELADLFEAYADCRTNKRNTMNALAFELDYEQELVTLWHEINAGTYIPGRSIAFIVDKPVKREIFAADFRDRVVHHLIINKLNTLFETIFIYDSSTRAAKGEAPTLASSVLTALSGNARTIIPKTAMY